MVCSLSLSDCSPASQPGGNTCRLSASMCGNSAFLPDGQPPGTKCAKCGVFLFGLAHSSGFPVSSKVIAVWLGAVIFQYLGQAQAFSD